MPANNIELTRYRNWARTVEITAAQFGEALGEDYDRATQVAREAGRIARENAGQVPLALPSDPAKVEAQITKAAAAEAGRSHVASIAAEIAERAENEATRLAIAEAPRIAALVKTTFDKAAVELAEVGPLAPTEITAASTADDFSRHTRALTLADELTRALQARVSLCPPLAEELQTATYVWLVLDPAPTATLAGVRAVLAEFAERLPATLEDWLQMIGVGSSLAAPQQASDRSTRFSQASYYSGMGSPDGGMIDKTYAEALSFLGADPLDAMTAAERSYERRAL